MSLRRLRGHNKTTPYQSGKKLVQNVDDVMTLYHKSYSYPLPKHIHTSDYHYVVLGRDIRYVALLTASVATGSGVMPWYRGRVDANI